MLKKIIYSRPEGRLNEYPFNLNWLDNNRQIDFNTNLTFFVGENGIGKSTLVQAIAIQNELPQLTNELYEENIEYQTIFKLSNCLKSHWTTKCKKGFFFRADDFISFIRKNNSLRNDLENELRVLDKKGVNKLSFERLPFQNSLESLKKTYPLELNKLSHGQSFLALFKNRLKANSLYILDEPETPLSPQNQLTLLCMIDEQIKLGSQFIIASHSPILTAHPEAEIYKLSYNHINKIDYYEIESVQFMKSFMSDPKRFMHYSFEN